MVMFHLLKSDIMVMAHHDYDYFSAASAPTTIWIMRHAGHSHMSIALWPLL